MIDDHQPADVVDQLGHRPQIGDRAQRSRRRGDRHQPRRLPNQALPLPCRQLTGFDVDLGPLHLRAVAVRRPQPRGDVGLVVEAADDHLVPQAGARGRRLGQRGQQDRAIGAQHDARRVGVEQIGHGRPRCVQHGRAALRRRVRTHGAGTGPAERRRDGGRDGIGDQHPGRRIEVHPSVTQRRMQSAHPGDVISHASHLRASAIPRNCDGSGCHRRSSQTGGFPSQVTRPAILVEWGSGSER